MAVKSVWSAPVACVGLAAYVGMLFRFPLLVGMVQAGEISVVQAAPTVLGAVMLLVASLGLLLRRPARGWMFAFAALGLLLGLIWLPTLVFSFWLWVAVLASIAGALVAWLGSRAQPPVH
jgi:hypothetical protein